MGIFDVPTARLIDAVAEELKNNIKEPEFTNYVKTGAHVERTPQRKDWFFVRNASILYQVYKNGASGTESLRTYYGGRKNRGVKPEKKRKASGKIIRVCLQELEKAGLLKKEKKGRVVSGKGEKLLYTKAKEIGMKFKEEIAKKEQEKQERLARAAERRKKQAEKEKELAKKKKEEAQEKPKEGTKPTGKPEAKNPEKEVKKDERGRKPEAKKA